MTTLYSWHKRFYNQHNQAQEARQCYREEQYTIKGKVKRAKISSSPENPNDSYLQGVFNNLHKSEQA